jgi:hypothetical protein
VLLADGAGSKSTAPPPPPGAPEPGTAAAMTELQKHAAYFDGDHDGIVTVEETYQGEPQVSSLGKKNPLQS